MAAEPKEIHYLPGYVESQVMTRVLQLNVFPWQIRQISPMLQAKKDKDSPRDETHLEVWAIWTCSS